jgi:hypothetical protein
MAMLKRKKFSPVGWQGIIPSPPTGKLVSLPDGFG